MQEMQQLNNLKRLAEMESQGQVNLAVPEAGNAKADEPKEDPNEAREVKEQRKRKAEEGNRGEALCAVCATMLVSSSH